LSLRFNRFSSLLLLRSPGIIRQLGAQVELAAGDPD
jgi:hypothetical protein